jgi:hypothetical protein
MKIKKMIVGYTNTVPVKFSTIGTWYADAWKKK